jgi:hypothetical protein
MKQTINYIYSAQKKNGSFVSLSSDNPENFATTSSYQTTFATSLILSALCNVKETPELKITKQNAARFLLAQKSEQWSWNYWTRESKEAKTMAYPDDLDDTFSALSALFLYDRKIIDGEALANIVSLLTTLEIKEGGPYKTWLVDKNAKKVWKDVDLAVNSNIAYFLYLNDIHLPKLSKFINSRIKNTDFSSPYYPSPFPIIYFISRFYNGKYNEKIIKYLLNKQQKDGSFGNPLQTSLAVSSLVSLGFLHRKLKLSIEYLLKNQSNNHWQAYGFCLDPAIDGRKFFSGSEALTTAFCLEALSKYQTISATQNIIPDKIQNVRQEKIYNAILKKVKKRLSFFDNSFKKIAITFINDITKNNTDKQILLLPYYFSQGLDETKNKISDELLIELGTANVFGWIAYTIYDNFLDEEGDPKTISLANVALRETAMLFECALPENKKFQIFSRRILDIIDAANYWEVKNCRDKTRLPNYGNYEKLAEKSLGHALGPLAILFSAGYDDKSAETKQLLKFFKHYLISRQLNDDAHDFEKDLKMEHINPVATLLLKKSKPNSSHMRLKKLFWENVLDEVSQIVLQHVKKGKTALNKCTIIVDKSMFNNLLVKYEKIAIKALEEKKQTMQFLKAYKK